MTDGVVLHPPLTSLVAALADNKLYLGRRYAEWCTAAPTLESAVAAAAMAQDEIGHARSLYPLLKDLVGESREIEPETRTQFTHATFLNEPFQSWTDFVAANFLFDTAITVLLESAQRSTNNALAQRARRIVEEEQLHFLHGEGWTRRLPSKGPAVRDDLAAALARVAPFALAWFDVGGASLVGAGVLDAESESMRQALRARVNPVLVDVGLALI